MKRYFAQLIASLRQKLFGLFLVDAVTELQTEIELAQADRLARLEAQARDYEQTGKPAAAAFLRAKAETLNLNLAGLADAEAGINHLFLTDATADPPPPALPAPAAGGGQRQQPNGNGHAGVAPHGPPVKRGPGRPPKAPAEPPAAQP